MHNSRFLLWRIALERPDVVTASTHVCSRRAAISGYRLASTPPRPSAHQAARETGPGDSEPRATLARLQRLPAPQRAALRTAYGLSAGPVPVRFVVGLATLSLLPDACTGVLPRWLAWLGIVVAIVLLFDVIYVNIVPLLIWVLAASIVLLMRREDTATVTASPRERVA